LLALAAVVEQDRVALVHGQKVISRLIIANAGPGGFALLYKVSPGVGLGFLLHQPELFRHGKVVGSIEPRGKQEKPKTRLANSSGIGKLHADWFGVVAQLVE